MTLARKPLTPHQREVFWRIVRLSRRFPAGVPAVTIGSRGACAHLVEKGYIVEVTRTGPRGGERISYRVAL